MPLPTVIENMSDIASAVHAGERIVVVDESEDYPGELLFQAIPWDEQEDFVRAHSNFLSPYCLLSDLILMEVFTDQLQEEGWKVVALPGARPALARYARWAAPLTVEGLRLPAGLHPFQQYGLRQAFDARQGRAKVAGFFFNFGTGCIQGDAEIVVNRAGNGRRIKLRDLVRRFNNKDDRYRWDLSIPTYVQREVKGVVRLGRLRSAWHSGVKQTYTVTTDTGRTVRATEEHPFLTERGWLRLDELQIGDEVHIRGRQARGLPRQPKPRYRQIGGLTHHPHSTTKGKDRVSHHRLVAEAQLNGVPVDTFIAHMRSGEVVGYEFLDPEVWAVHHHDHNHTNNASGNLKVLTHEEHHRQHAHEGKTDNVLYKIETEQIVSVEPWGLEETYDLEVDDEPHNFIANGFVVHNTGKSVVAAAGMQELMINREEVDLCLFFTMRKLRINMARKVEELTDVKAQVIEGTKERRVTLYERIKDGTSPVRCILLNYEKAHFDYEHLEELVAGRRVLFVFDEVQKIVRGENAMNRARHGMDNLIRVPDKSTVWPMSASIVKASPLRYHNIYELLGKNPLGTRKDFIARYCTRVDEYELRPGVVLRDYHWNKVELTEVRHRTSGKTLAVRKTDPGVREFFKGMETQVVYVQASPEERKLRGVILDDAERAQDAEDDFSITSHYNCLRYISNTPEALRYSESEAAQRIVDTYPRLVASPSSKFEMICDKIEDIREQGDQVVVFTQWTYLTLFLFAKELTARKIRYVTHYGTGMTDREAQQSQDSFKSDPDITVFLSSDAGAYGLNFQNARFVINIECPYDPDILMQRNDRIDRADSYLEGLTSYVYVVEDSVEERIWKINEARRQISAATQGTVETLSRFSAEELAMSEGRAMHGMVFGGSLARR